MLSSKEQDVAAVARSMLLYLKNHPGEAIRFEADIAKCVLGSIGLMVERVANHAAGLPEPNFDGPEAWADHLIGRYEYAMSEVRKAGLA